MGVSRGICNIRYLPLETGRLCVCVVELNKLLLFGDIVEKYRYQACNQEFRQQNVRIAL